MTARLLQRAWPVPDAAPTLNRSRYLHGGGNALVRQRNEVRNAWAQIDVQLKRRHDLIPNLVDTVKGFMQHERETLEAVIAARGAAVAGL